MATTSVAAATSRLPLGSPQPEVPAPVGPVEKAVTGTVNCITRPLECLGDGIKSGAKAIDGALSKDSPEGAPSEQSKQGTIDHSKDPVPYAEFTRIQLEREQFANKVRDGGLKAADLTLNGEAPDGTRYYEVQKGGTLQAVAKALTPSPTNLENLNPTLKGHKLKSGDLVFLGYTEMPKLKEE